MVVATLEKGTVRAGRDDRTDITLRKNRRRPMDTPSETKKDTEGELA